jgi:hypothetical protein
MQLHTLDTLWPAQELLLDFKLHFLSLYYTSCF